MQFLNPQALWLLALAVVPALLYLFRRKSKSINVSTLVFFKTLAREHQESAWLRRLKKLISFILSLLFLILPILVLGRMVSTQEDAEQIRSVVILIDRSASMSVQNKEGETRLDEAKRILLRRLELVPENAGVALIAYDARAEVLQSSTYSRRELVSKLSEIEVRPIAAKPAAAFESALLLASLEGPSVIWHASDRAIRGSQIEIGQVDGSVLSISIEELNVANDSVVNPGITAFQLRSTPLQQGRYDVFLQVALNEDAETEMPVRVESSIGGLPSQIREIELSPGQRKNVSLQLSGSEGQMLNIKLKSERDDFVYDNEIVLRFPEAHPVLAAWIRPDDREDPYTRLALSSIQEAGSLEILKGSPSAWPLTEKVDVVIFDGWLPDEWPEDTPVILVNPPDSDGTLKIRGLRSPVPHREVRVGNEAHPVLFRVSSGRVALTQTAIFSDQGTMEPLWFAGEEAVLSAGEIHGQRVVVMAFSPGQSEQLPLMASFPLLMGNALYWCVEPATNEKETSIYPSGTMAQLEGTNVLWTDSHTSSRLPLKSDVLEMDRIGFWETDQGYRGGSYLLSEVESNIPAQSKELEPNDYFRDVGAGTGEIKFALLAVLASLLLLESLLLHRFAVY